MLKKILALILTLALLLTLCVACSLPSDDFSTVENNITNATSNTASTDDIPTEPLETESPEPPTAPTLSDEDKLEMYEFLTSREYRQLQQTAFKFFKAYTQADIETAKSLMDSPDNKCLSWFPTEKNSMDDVTVYFVLDVSQGYYEKDGEQIETTYIAITIARESPVFGLMGSVDLYIGMIYVDEYNEAMDFYYKVWKISYFDISP